MDGFDTYPELLSAVEESAADVRTLGYAPGGNPIVAAETGGEKEPAILITAGAHSTEHAGVRAAVALVEELEPAHRTYVVPTRDPVGLNGLEYAIDLAIDCDVSIGTHDEARAVLEAEGEIIHEDEEEEIVVALVGDYGFAIRPLDDGGGVSILQRFKEYTQTNPAVLDRLAGRRVFTSAGYDDVDEAAPFERTYTLIVDPDGMPLHLNRFFTDDWAPPETRAVRGLMAEIEPGLTFDNHETTGHGARYHVSLRPQRTPEGDVREEQIADAITTAVEERGVELATDEDVLSEPTRTVAEADEEDRPEGGFYSRATDGAYWVDPNLTSPPRLGEGLNATDYAAEHYGLAYTLETGMYGSFETRVDAAITSVRTGVGEFEKLH